VGLFESEDEGWEEASEERIRAEQASGVRTGSEDEAFCVAAEKADSSRK
jgi:hypothetical protein